MGKRERNPADWDRLTILYVEYLRGVPVSTEVLFSELARVLNAYFNVRVRSDAVASDLAQATLLKIHFARDRFDVGKSLKTWVFTIASRTLIDHWRGSALENSRMDTDYGEEDEFNSALDSLPSLELDPSLKTELHQDLNEALKTLKPIDRSIVYLYGVEGLSMAEVGTALQMSEGAAKIRAHRAYKELRKYLGLWTFILLRELF